ncbi:MAG: energy transducer TonB [Bacteroidales bacterium]|nr:energy transducer TonB [Bacteroidales bacterium]
MKNTLLLLLLIILPGTILLGQNSDTLQTQVDPEVNPLYLSNKESFQNDFQIDIQDEKSAKILAETFLLVNPQQSPDNTSIKIPKGQVITSYKFLPQSKCWAVKFGNYYGFIPTQDLMPIQSKSEPSNYSPYDEAPQVLNRLKVKYPRYALDNGIEGVVSVKTLIGKNGTVRETEIVKGIPELNVAAEEAVKKLKFKPGKYKGNPVEVWIRIPVTFAIESF